MNKNNLSANLSFIAKVSKDISADCLFEINRFFQAVPRVKSLSTACNPFALEMVAEIKQANERKRIRDTLRRLEKKKLLKISKMGDKMEFTLTKSGKIESIKVGIKKCEDELPGGEHCVVVFDVPEHVRRARDAFRSFLKSVGFIQLQRSVWISPKNVAGSLVELVKLMKVGGWVSIYCGKKFV